MKKFTSLSTETLVGKSCADTIVGLPSSIQKSKGSILSYKPTLFIASSTESVVVARAIQRELTSVATVSVWDQAQFRPSRFPLESLLDILGRSDLGVFIFAPDDNQGVAGGKPMVRDNVLIELGLFIGRLGRDRVAIVVRDDVQPKIPSDLHGLTLLKYRVDRSDRNLTAAIAPAADMIRMMLTDVPEPSARRLPELDLSLMSLRSQLSRNQRTLLRIIEHRGSCTVRELLEMKKPWSYGELHYRLEQLRIFSFVCIANPAEAAADRANAVYALQDHYRSEYRNNPPPLEQITLSPADEQTGETHLPSETSSMSLEPVVVSQRNRRK